MVNLIWINESIQNKIIQFYILIKIFNILFSEWLNLNFYNIQNHIRT